MLSLSTGFAAAATDTGVMYRTKLLPHSRELQPKFDADGDFGRVAKNTGLKLSFVGSSDRPFVAESRLNGAMNRSLWVDSMTDRQTERRFRSTLFPALLHARADRAEWSGVEWVSEYWVCWLDGRKDGWMRSWVARRKQENIGRSTWMRMPLPCGP